MSENGEAGQDDYGLPSVDIEIPDDARELDRDVQAYYREQRASRRRLRNRRLVSSSLLGHGTVRPMVAGMLVLALLSGVLLVLFSAGQFAPGAPAPGGTATGTSQLPGTASISAPGASRQPGSHPAAGQDASGGASGGAPAGSRTTAGTTAGPSRATGARLPHAVIVVAGRNISLRSLSRAAIALVGPGCGCLTALQQLIMQALRAQVTLYLVGAASVQPELARLARSNRGGRTRTATDVSNALGNAYHPAGLTVLLVDSRGTVRQHASLRPGFVLEPQLASLRLAS